jgi:hypothetical protein
MISIIMLVFIMATAGWALAQTQQEGGAQGVPEERGMQQSRSYEEGSGWFCPWCGGQGDEPMAPTTRYRRGGAYMMDPPPQCPRQRGGYYGRGMMYDDRGRMHRDRGMHGGWGRGQDPRGRAREMAPMEKDEVRVLIRNYTAGNPNLKVGEIAEQEEVFVAEVVTQDGSLVEKLVVDKQTGWMRRKY